MKNKTVLVTGSTDGIGMQTALELAKLGAHVLIHARNQERGLKVLDYLRAETSNQNIALFVADFSSLAEVKAMAEEIKSKYQKLDVLINNAGILLKKYHLSEDGFEYTFAVNHLAPFSLTLQLLPIIAASDQGRILNVSSIAHTNSPLLGLERIHAKETFGGYQTYALTKLCNVLFTYELASRLRETPITVNTMHPGTIGTKLLMAGFNMGGASLETGAKTPVYLAANPDLAKVTAKYYTNMKEVRSSSYSYREDIREMLWDYSEDSTNIYLNHYFYA